MSRTFSSVYKNNYSSDYVDILKMKCTKTCAINNYPIYDLSIYLTKTNAALTYLTITDAAAEFANYLTITDAASTYLTIIDASSTYLRIIDASTDYLSRIGVATSIATSTSFNGGDIFIQGIRAGVGNFKSTVDASLNTCFGRNALSNTTSAINASAFGNGALAALQTGIDNDAFGYYALNAFTGTPNARNAAFGSHSLSKLTTGARNVGVGWSSGYFLTGNASDNTFVGNDAGDLIDGSGNTFVGSGSGKIGGNSPNNSTGLGFNATCSYSNSTVIGYLSVATANHQIMLGTAAEYVECPGTTASGSLIAAADIYINGIRAGAGLYRPLADVSMNTCFGINALGANLSGIHNSAFGNTALEALTSGGDNSAFGHHALNKLTGSGNNSIRNTAVGSNALGNIITGSKNAVFGQGAGQSIGSSICNENTLIGYLANANSSGGSYNTFIGSNASDTVGGSSSSTALGAYSSTNAYYSTALGAFSTSNHQFSTAIGGGSGLSSGTPSGTPGATTTANHQIMLGTAAETVVCPGTDASGSLVLYGGLTLQTTYSTAPTSNMLGYRIVLSGIIINSITTGTSQTIGSLALTAGVWSLNYTFELLANTSVATSQQSFFFSSASGALATYDTRIANTGTTRFHSAMTYANTDNPSYSGGGTYYASAAINLYPAINITFTGGTLSGTGYASATRIG